MDKTTYHNYTETLVNDRGQVFTRKHLFYPERNVKYVKDTTFGKNTVIVSSATEVLKPYQTWWEKVISTLTFWK